MRTDDILWLFMYLESDWIVMKGFISVIYMRSSRKSSMLKLVGSRSKLILGGFTTIGGILEENEVGLYSLLKVSNWLIW